MYQIQFDWALVNDRDPMSKVSSNLSKKGVSWTCMISEVKLTNWVKKTSLLSLFWNQPFGADAGEIPSIVCAWFLESFFLAVFFWFRVLSIVECRRVFQHVCSFLFLGMLLAAASLQSAESYHNSSWKSVSLFDFLPRAATWQFRCQTRKPYSTASG